MSHKGSRSRIQDQQAARDTWERVFGKKDISHAFRDEKRKSKESSHELAVLRIAMGGKT